MSVDGTSSKPNPLEVMLDKAFQTFDQNKDGKLDQSEFASFNEVLKPGDAIGLDGKPTTDFSKKMDQNSDDSITQDEMDSTTVLMPASLTSTSFGSLISYLNAQATPESMNAASILNGDSVNK